MYHIVIPFVARWEGFMAYPYYCPTGHLTIGYGTLIKRGQSYGHYDAGYIIHVSRQLKKDNHHNLRKTNIALKKHFGTIISKEQAKYFLEQSLKSFWREIAFALPKGLNDNQCAAILSLAYNIGVSAFKSSTMLKRLKAGNIKGAALALTWWNKGRIDGKMQVITGLRRRRLDEKNLFLS